MGLGPLTGLWRIMVTRFFCSIMLKSWRRSAAMFRARRYSGSSSAKPPRYRGPGTGGEGRGSGLAAVLILLASRTDGPSQPPPPPPSPQIQIAKKPPKILPAAPRR